MKVVMLVMNQRGMNKLLEDKFTEVVGWEGGGAAWDLIGRGQEAYRAGEHR